jgi:hypothetical protein
MGFDKTIRNNQRNTMKNSKTQLVALLLSTVSLLTRGYGQLTPSQHAYTNTADPTRNYGA